MRPEKQAKPVNGFNKFITEMISQYHLSHDEIMHAVEAFGEFRTKIWSYCVVQHYLRKKGLPLEDAKKSIVNRWFPS